MPAGEGKQRLIHRNPVAWEQTGPWNSPGLGLWTDGFRSRLRSDAGCWLQRGCWVGGLGSKSLLVD